jgi:hypothetical protein
MADCPFCDEWRYDGTAECLMARPVGQLFPVVYADGRLRVAYGSEAPGGPPPALGAHICFEHPMEPDVLILGPVEKCYPLAGLNQLVNALLGERPRRSRMTH